MLKLYTTTLSANGRKPLAAARHLRIDIEVHTVNVYAGEGNTESYRVINPWGKIPTLVDGDFILWESNAILVYLCEKFSHAGLYPPGAMVRAQILKWLFWESSSWQPVLGRVLGPKVGQVLFGGHDAEEIITDWDDGELRPLLVYLQEILTNRLYLAGDQISIADFAVAGMTSYFPACRFPTANYPAIGQWMQRLNACQAWYSTVDPLWL